MEIKQKIKKQLVNILENKEKYITKQEAENLIKSSKGKIFTVTFIKKDGTERVMNARLGVKVYLKGGSLPYNPEDMGYIPLFDIKIKEYRILNLNTIKELKISNNVYKVK